MLAILAAFTQDLATAAAAAQAASSPIEYYGPTPTLPSSYQNGSSSSGSPYSSTTGSSNPGYDEPEDSSASSPSASASAALAVGSGQIDSSPELYEPLAQIRERVGAEALAAGMQAFGLLPAPSYQWLRDRHGPVFGLLAGGLAMSGSFGVTAW